MRNLPIIGCIILHLASVIIALYSIFCPYWSEIQGHSYSLTSCEDCSGFNKNWSLECTARASYHNHLSNSDTYENAYKAGAFYLYIETIFVISSFLLFEKLILILLRQDYGNSTIIYWLLIINSSLQIVSTSLWHIYKHKKSGIHSETGPKVSIAASVWTPVSNILIGLVFYKQKYENQVYLSLKSNKLGIQLKHLLILSLTLMLVSGCLIIASLSTSDWVKSPSFQGGLIRCADCSETPSLSWSCLSSLNCESNSKSHNCKIFSRLSKASTAYLILSATSLFFLLLSSQSIIFYLTSRQYSIFYLNYVIPKQTYLLISFFLQLISCIVWSSITEMTFSTNCKNELCADTGAQISIASIFFLFSALIVFFFCKTKNLKIAVDSSHIIETEKLNHKENFLSTSDVGGIGKIEAIPTARDEKIVNETNGKESEVKLLQAVRISVFKVSDPIHEESNDEIIASGRIDAVPNSSFREISIESSGVEISAEQSVQEWSIESSVQEKPEEKLEIGIIQPKRASVFKPTVERVVRGSVVEFDVPNIESDESSDSLE